jgi:hypothetical protein
MLRASRISASPSARQIFLPKVCPVFLSLQSPYCHRTVYSLDDVNGDTSFNSFSMNNAPSYLFEVLNDIQFINHILKVGFFFRTSIDYLN